MRILLVNTKVPFIYGGAELLEERLFNALLNAGYEVDRIDIPFRWFPKEYILKTMLISSLIDLEQFTYPVDMVISLKFPSYYVKHPKKVIWLLHHHRSFYDLWNTPFCDLPHDKETETLRQIVREADTRVFKKAKRIFALSRTVSERLMEFNGIDAEVLYCPVDKSEFFCEDYKELILFPSRISAIKRQDLAIECARFISSPVKIIIVGKPDDDHYYSRILDMIKNYGLDEKIEIKGWVSRKELLKLYANCLAVLFPTYNEDYGFITVEAMYSKKPVITCKDSGGATEFVEDKITGIISDPDPLSLAESIDYVYKNRDKAIQMGKNGYEKINSFDLSWDKVVERLTCL